MAELKKDGIRAVMSEAAERETLKGMGQRTNSKEVELKPCPFCGVTPTRKDHVYRYGSIAEHPEDSYCPIKNATIGIKDWNTRVSADSAGAMVETGWLLEKTHNGQVWYVTANSMLEWTDDPNKALRLARHEDAEALCTIVEDADKIASHEWVPVPSAPKEEEVHPEDFCQKCGRPNVVWFAPNNLWNKAVRAKNEPGILCPVCFIELAEAIGIREVWKVAPNEKSARKLTAPELNHLSGLLEARRDEGSYTGSREQYYARTERLIQWCNDQMKGQSNGPDKDNRNLS